MAGTLDPAVIDKMADTNERMADILEQLQKQAPPHEPGFGSPEYQQRLRDEGYFDEFPVKVYQNGRQAEPRGIPAEIREKTGQLKAGTHTLTRYGKSSTVTVDRTDKMVHLKYGSQEIEQRMRYPWNSFEDLIEMLWLAQHPTPTAA